MTYNLASVLSFHVNLTPKGKEKPYVTVFRFTVISLF